MMRQGQVEVLSLYLKQKLNVKSSTEGELVGAHKTLNVVFWSKIFIVDQLYAVDNEKMYQYNNSAIFIENNSR